MLIANRYQVIEKLGQGGMGAVYLATDTFNNRKVAVKQLMVESKTPSNLERFKTEIASMTYVKHKGIVEILDFKLGKGDNDNYIVQEYVNGINLEKVIKKRVFLDQKEAVYYMLQILDAVEVMAKNSILHRDLKPSNIMITNSGKVKICDFGLARSQTFNLAITNAGNVAGTAYYIAPEVHAKYKQTIQSEIYSLGIILFEMLTGSKPFIEDGSSPNKEMAHKQVIYRIRNSPLPSVTNITKEVPQALENVVIKATAKKSNERYQTFVAMKQDLSTVFSKSREFEQKFSVINKFTHMFDLEKLETQDTHKNKINLPIHSVVFITILFIILIGVFVYYVF